MNVLVNGAACDHLTVFDRGLQYGDGVFETICVQDSKPRLWPDHMARLLSGCQRLQISAPDCELLWREAATLCVDQPKGVLKIVITRGAGSRGYRVITPLTPNRILSTHPAPTYAAANWREGVRVRICAQRLGHNPQLAGLKHLNRLEQVLARQEWQDEDIAEGILRDQDGNVIGGVMSNVFLVLGDKIVTPALDRCGVAGVMRNKVLQMLRENAYTTEIRPVPQDEFLTADEVFVTNSLIGIWPVKSVDNQGSYRLYVSKTLQSLLDQYLWYHDENVV